MDVRTTTIRIFAGSSARSLIASLVFTNPSFHISSTQPLSNFVKFYFRTFEELNITEKALMNMAVDGGKITEGGVRTNVSIALQYLNQWFKVCKIF